MTYFYFFKQKAEGEKEIMGQSEEGERENLWLCRHTLSLLLETKSVPPPDASDPHKRFTPQSLCSPKF